MCQKWVTAVTARVLKPVAGPPDRMNQATPPEEPNSTKRAEIDCVEV